MAAEQQDCGGCVFRGSTACGAHMVDAAADLIEEQVKRIAELEAQLILRQDELLQEREKHRWIPVEERLPEEHDSVWADYYGTDKWDDHMIRKLSDEVAAEFIYDNGEKIVTKVRSAYTADGEWRLAGGTRLSRYTKITRWKPMPEVAG